MWALIILNLKTPVSKGFVLPASIYSCTTNFLIETMFHFCLLMSSKITPVTMKSTIKLISPRQIIRKIYHYLRTEKTLAILPIARILFLIISFRAAAEPTFNGINKKKGSSLEHPCLCYSTSLFHAHLNKYKIPYLQLKEGTR